MGQGKQQQARGTRPDGISDDAFHLVKRVSSLEATYQVRLLTYFAMQQKKRLVIVVPADFTAAPSLKALMDKSEGTIDIRREAPQA